MKNLDAVYASFGRGIRNILGLPIPSDWRQCSICKKMVPVQYMAIQAVGGANWTVGDAKHCGRCAEGRAEGTKDDDGVTKRIGRLFCTRLEEGFSTLLEYGRFGE